MGVKLAVFSMALVFTGNMVFASDMPYKCVNSAKKELSFIVSFNSETIAFKNIESLGYAQLETEKELPFSYDSSSRTLDFIYDWYLTAYYSMTFDKQLKSDSDLRVVNMKLSGDDYDGSVFNYEEFQCHLQ